MYCNLLCITENRNISERKTTHAKNDSGVRPILQRRTMLVPAQQSLLKSVTRLLESKKKVGRVIETKSKPSDQRIKLETRKEDRTGWQSTRLPGGLGEHNLIFLLLQFPVCKMAISHLIRLACGRLGSGTVSRCMPAHFLAKSIRYCCQGKQRKNSRTPGQLNQTVRFTINCLRTLTEAFPTGETFRTLFSHGTHGGRWSWGFFSRQTWNRRVWSMSSVGKWLNALLGSR